MDTKSKIVKTAKICQIAAKVLYFIAIAACPVFIALAIALSLTDAIAHLSPPETAVLFGTMAVYAFIGVGLFWNVEGLFKSIAKEQAPFGEAVGHYLIKIAVFVLLLSAIPAFLGTLVAHIACPETELSFPIEVGGIITGGVLFLIGMFFQYGNELQEMNDESEKKDDEAQKKDDEAQKKDDDEKKNDET